ncbi:MAG TPA: FAD:protein FMN transferase [Pseudonocardiaceae bacterium]|nr:FAD:protein FMN transferase [Pseudonocardiaceae bacterium]
MRTAVEHIMGTAISIAAPDSVAPQQFQAATAVAFGYLRHIDDVFSPFRKDSPISHLRDGRLRLSDLDGHPHGPAIREVLDLCEVLKQASGGAFDAWAVGDPPGFDPSGAVKGWAAEHASGLLVDAGLPRHALNAGGDVRVHGVRTDDFPWRVGITDPHRPDTVLAVVAIHAGAVATSGVAERGAHIWHPHTTRRATALAQVTVTGPDLTLADGYATAAVAMNDVRAAHTWLRGLDPGHQAMTVDPAGHVWRTAGMAALTRPSVAAAPRSG